MILLVLSCLSVIGGERVVRLTRASEPIQVPQPQLDGAALDLARQEVGKVEWRGRFRGAAVDASVEIGDKPVDYREFAALAVEALRSDRRDAVIGGTPMRLSDPEVVAQDRNSLIMTQTAREERRHRRRDGDGPRWQAANSLAFGHVYLYGRHVLLTLRAETDAPADLGSGMDAWVDALLRLNADGVDESPAIRMDAPGRGGVYIPFPEGFDRFSDESHRGDRPAFSFTDQGRRDRGKSRRFASAILILDQPVSPDEFRRMAPSFDKVFLDQPSGRVLERGRDSTKYSVTDSAQTVIIYTVVFPLSGSLLRFDYSVPNDNRRLRERAERALDEWCEAARDLNRRGGREGPGRHWGGRQEQGRPRPGVDPELLGVWTMPAVGNMGGTYEFRPDDTFTFNLRVDVPWSFHHFVTTGTYRVTGDGIVTCASVEYAVRRYRKARTGDVLEEEKKSRLADFTFNYVVTRDGERPALQTNYNSDGTRKPITPATMRLAKGDGR